MREAAAGDQVVGHADRSALLLQLAAHLGGEVCRLLGEREDLQRGEKLADEGAVALASRPAPELEDRHRGRVDRAGGEGVRAAARAGASSKSVAGPCSFFPFHSRFLVLNPRYLVHSP